MEPTNGLDPRMFQLEDLAPERLHSHIRFKF